MIGTLPAEDRDDCMPLWRGCQGSYAADIPDVVSAVTWARLLDPAEPVGGRRGGRARAPRPPPLG